MLEPTRSGERKSTLEPARFVYLYRDYGKQVFAVTCCKRNRALSIAMHSGALEPAISAVRVENESGQQVDRGDCHVGADDTSLLALLIVLVVIGASNRYISVPILKLWAGQPPKRRGAFYRFLPGKFLPHLPPHADIRLIARQFALKVRLEALLVVIVLFWTAVLLHSVPAAHLAHMGM